MCKKGDIIFVHHYKHKGVELSGHPFVVLEDNAGEIFGVSFDMICLVMSSFKDEAQMKRKLSYGGNFPVKASDKTLRNFTNKDAFIKADQFYYFDRSNLDFSVIGSVDIDAWEALLTFIEGLAEKGLDILHITDNLQ